MTVERLGFAYTVDATVEPCIGDGQTIGSIFFIAGVRRAFVERHDDVGTDDTLNVHYVFGSEHVVGAIDMRFEFDTFRVDFPVGREAVNLVATAIGQYRFVPSIEAMQATCLVDDVGAGSKVEVVGIAQNDLSFDILIQVLLGDGFDSAGGAHGHKYGSFDGTVIGSDDTSASFAVGVRRKELKM